MNKVAIFRSSLLAPSETFIKEQALALKDWSPTLIGYRRLADGLDLTGLNVHLLSGMSAGRAQRWRTKIGQWRGKPHPPTVQALRSLGVGLVHAHFGTDGTDIWPSVKAAGLPLLVTLHGYDINIHRQWWESGKGGLRGRNYPRRLLAMARDPDVRFIAVSKAIRKRAIDYGIPEDKVTVAYIGVDTERFKPGGLPIEQRAKRILFVGRMVEKKAPLLLIRAYAEVRESVPDAELVMVGDGPLLADAKRLAQRLKVPVNFMGRCKPCQVLEQMHEARIFCLPSVVARNGDAEGLPIVILEALASGLPVVTSACGAVGDVIVSGRNGVAFEVGSISGLATGVRQLLSSSHDCQRFSRMARRSVERHFAIAETKHTLSTAYDSAGTQRTRLPA